MQKHCNGEWCGLSEEIFPLLEFNLYAISNVTRFFISNIIFELLSEVTKMRFKIAMKFYIVIFDDFRLKFKENDEIPAKDREKLP